MAKILVIDDEPALCEMLCDTLGEEGHAVLAAPNGLEGLALLAKTPVDLVITDIFMPDMEGIEMIRHVRRDYPKVKVITISGGGTLKNVNYLDVSEQLGADWTLQKPVGTPELIAAIDAVLSRQS